MFGGYFDEEFAEHTIPLFNRLHNDEFTLLFSTVTQEELDNAPKRVKELVSGLKAEWTEYLDVTEETVELATEYVPRKLLDKPALPIVYTLRLPPSAGLTS